MRTYEDTRNRSGPAPIPLSALRRSGADGAAFMGPVTLHYSAGVGHNFSSVRVHSAGGATPWRDDAPQPGRLKGGESFSEQGARMPTPNSNGPPAPMPECPPMPARVPAQVPAPAAPRRPRPLWPPLRMTIVATRPLDSHKNIRFDVTILRGHGRRLCPGQQAKRLKRKTAPARLSKSRCTAKPSILILRIGRWICWTRTGLLE